MLALAVLAVAAGCSSGGDNGPELAKVRFLNGTPTAGTVVFEIKGVRQTLAPREAGPTFEVEPGLRLEVMVWSDSLGKGSVQLMDIVPGSENVIASRTTPAGITAGSVVANAGAVAGSRVYYQGWVDDQPPIDLYVVPPGGEIAAATPLLQGIAGQNGTSGTAPIGTFQVVITRT